jgi:hypothetical protein
MLKNQIIVLKQFIVLYFLVASNLIFCQIEFTKVTFEILEFETENLPMPGVNILVINKEEIIETQTDFNGKAELLLQKLNVEIKITTLGPSIKFKLIENIDFVKIELKKKRATFYSQNKIRKKIRLKFDGF